MEPEAFAREAMTEPPWAFPGGAHAVFMKARSFVTPFWEAALYASPWATGRRRARFEQAGIPMPPTTFGVLAGVATDELAKAIFTLARRAPTSDELVRFAREADVAIAQYDRAGWLDDPSGYHTAPGVPNALLEPLRFGFARGECLRFESAWRPHASEPGADRWSSFRPNEVVRAYVLRHHDGPRPWLVCVHATEMGRPEIDRRLFRAQYLHHRFGLNVVMPVLPLHGARRPVRGSGAFFPTLDILDNVHGLAQAASDVRSVIAWVREQDPLGVGLIGVSLGGYVVALVAGLDAALDCVIAGLPVVDFPHVFKRNAPPEVRSNPRYDELVSLSALVHRVVSPLEFSPATPVDRRFVFAGQADRLVDPVRHAAALWNHWGRPEIHWFPGGHVGHLVARGINRFVDDALERTSLVAA